LVTKAEEFAVVIPAIVLLAEEYKIWFMVVVDGYVAVVQVGTPPDTDKIVEEAPTGNLAVTLDPFL
jgi:hypothetical protein